MISDLRKHNVKLAQETIEANCNMRVLRSKLMNAKKEIFKLREKNRNDSIEPKYNIEYCEGILRGFILISSTKTNNNDRRKPSRETSNYECRFERAAGHQCGGGHSGVGRNEKWKISVWGWCTGWSHEIRRWHVVGIDNGSVQQMSGIGENTKVMGKCSNHIAAQKRRHNEAGKLSTNQSVCYQLSTSCSWISSQKGIRKRLDFYQPVEQAGFRSGYSTNDHLQVMRTLIEKCNEYKIPIVKYVYENATS